MTAFAALKYLKENIDPEQVCAVKLEMHCQYLYWRRIGSNTLIGCKAADSEKDFSMADVFRLQGSDLTLRWYPMNGTTLEDQLVAGVFYFTVEIRHDSGTTEFLPVFFCEGRLEDFLGKDSPIVAEYNRILNLPPTPAELAAEEK